MLGHTSGVLGSIKMYALTPILKWHMAYLKRNLNKLGTKREKAQGMLDWLNIPEEVSPEPLLRAEGLATFK